MTAVLATADWLMGGLIFACLLGPVVCGRSSLGPGGDGLNPRASGRDGLKPPSRATGGQDATRTKGARHETVQPQ